MVCNIALANLVFNITPRSHTTTWQHFRNRAWSSQGTRGPSASALTGETTFGSRQHNNQAATQWLGNFKNNKHFISLAWTHSKASLVHFCRKQFLGEMQVLDWHYFHKNSHTNSTQKWIEGVQISAFEVHTVLLTELVDILNLYSQESGLKVVIRRPTVWVSVNYCSRVRSGSQMSLMWYLFKWKLHENFQYCRVAKIKNEYQSKLTS